MLRYGYFDSEITGYDGEGMPIFDRAESSDFLAMFISRIISDGVLAAPGDCFQVVAFEGMKLKVRPGFGIVRGRFAMDDKEYEITVPRAPTANRRIDRVILRANYLQRCCEIIVREGTPGISPAPPDLLRPESGDYYELCLATVALNSNQTAITQTNITDTRYDSRVCGVVTQVIDHLDTSVFFAQLNQFYEEFVEQSGESYDKFVADMGAYLEALEASGDSRVDKIVQDLTEFETLTERQVLDWFESVQGIINEDTAMKFAQDIAALKSGKVDKTGGTMTGRLMNRGGTSVYLTTEQSGHGNGFIKVARFENLMPARNHNFPIILELVKRRALGSVILFVSWQGINATNGTPSLRSFGGDGDYGAVMVNAEDDVWDLYVQSQASNAHVEIVRFSKPQYDSNVKVTFYKDQFVTALPSGTVVGFSDWIGNINKNVSNLMDKMAALEAVWPHVMWDTGGWNPFTETAPASVINDEAK